MQTTIRAEPNVTPMIDVMLVQLFIFVVIRPILVNGAQAIPRCPNSLLARRRSMRSP